MSAHETPLPRQSKRVFETAPNNTHIVKKHAFSRAMQETSGSHSSQRTQPNGLGIVFIVQCDVAIILGHIRIVLSFKFAFIWIPYEYFALCDEAYLKCCNYIGKSNVAGTYSTHLLSLRSCVIQKLLHYTDTNFNIDMVLKRMAFYCKMWRSYNFWTH